MLGEQIGQGSGRIESIRVLPDRSLSSSGPPELEVSFQGTGELLGLAVSVVGTYSQIILPSGSLYGEGRTLFITEDGETLSWKGFGVGRSTGRGSAASFGVAGAFLATSPRLARLSNVVTVAEYVIDEERNLQWQGWEWTGPVRTVPLEPESSAEAMPSTTGAV